MIGPEKYTGCWADQDATNSGKWYGGARIKLETDFTYTRAQVGGKGSGKTPPQGWWWSPHGIIIHEMDHYWGHWPLTYHIDSGKEYLVAHYPSDRLKKKFVDQILTRSPC